MKHSCKYSSSKPHVNVDVNVNVVALLMAALLLGSCSTGDDFGIDSTNESYTSNASSLSSVSYVGYWVAGSDANNQSIYNEDNQTEKVPATVVVSNNVFTISRMPYETMMAMVLSPAETAEAVQSLDGNQWSLAIANTWVKGYTDQTVYVSLGIGNVPLHVSYGGEEHTLTLVFSPESVAFYDTSHQLLTLLLRLDRIDVDGQTLKTCQPAAELLFSTVKKK